jgi:hypothetical protein
MKIFLIFFQYFVFILGLIDFLNLDFKFNIIWKSCKIGPITILYKSIQSSDVRQEKHNHDKEVP